MLTLQFQDDWHFLISLSERTISYASVIHQSSWVPVLAEYTILGVERCRLHVIMESKGKFQFAIDRGGTFTDIYARCPGGKIRVMKLLSVDPANYPDAPREGIRRILEEVSEMLVSIFEVSDLRARGQFKYCAKCIFTWCPSLMFYVTRVTKWIEWVN